MPYGAVCALDRSQLKGLSTVPLVVVLPNRLNDMCLTDNNTASFPQKIIVIILLVGSMSCSRK